MKTELYNKWVDIVEEEGENVDKDPFINALYGTKNSFNHWGCLVEAIRILHTDSKLEWGHGVKVPSTHLYFIDADSVDQTIPLIYNGHNLEYSNSPPESVVRTYASSVDIDSFDAFFEQSKLPFLAFLCLPSTKRYLCLT